MDGKVLQFMSQQSAAAFEGLLSLALLWHRPPFKPRERGHPETSCAVNFPGKSVELPEQMEKVDMDGHPERRLLHSLQEMPCSFD